MTRVRSSPASGIPVPIPFARIGVALALSWAASLFAQAPPIPAAADADGVQRVTITGGSYFFKPDRVIAKAGQPLDLIVRMEEGIVPHRFVLERPDGKPVVDVELAAMPKTLRVDLPPGDYPFYCSNRLLLFKSHRERGMSGTLEMRE